MSTAERKRRLEVEHIVESAMEEATRGLSHEEWKVELESAVDSILDIPGGVRLEDGEVVGRGWIRKVEENGECRSWLVDEVGWKEAMEHLQVALVRRGEE